MTTEAIPAQGPVDVNVREKREEDALAQIALGVAETHRNRAARTGNLEDAAHARRYQAMGEALSEINRQLNRAPRQVEPGSQASWEAKHG